MKYRVVRIASNKTHLAWTLSVLLSVMLAPISSFPAAAQSDQSLGAPMARISPVGFITWWSHDATGYHPAIYLWLENTSGVDLSGQPIKFQGLFRDLRNGYVTVARNELHSDFKPTQALRMALVAPTAFELPIDKFSWPSIECKVMCRIGSVGDEGTQDVIITKVEQQTMTDEEAFQRLIEGPHMVAHRRKERAVPAKPMSATALSLAAPATHPASNDRKGGLSHYIQTGSAAGLGSDFYVFDQSFGKAADYDAKDPKWTWVRYMHNDPPFTLYAGARGRASKVDMIVVTMPADAVQQESQLIALAKSLSGEFKSQALSNPVKSVKYLPTGRVQLTTAQSRSYKMFVTSPLGADNNQYIIGLSRMQGDPRATLAENAKRIGMLRFLTPAVADAEQD